MSLTVPQHPKPEQILADHAAGGAAASSTDAEMCKMNQSV